MRDQASLGDEETIGELPLYEVDYGIDEEDEEEEYQKFLALAKLLDSDDPSKTSQLAPDPLLVTHQHDWPRKP